MPDMSVIEQQDEYCPRCEIVFQISRNPGKAMSIVLPPHDVRCPKVAHVRPKPL